MGSIPTSRASIKQKQYFIKRYMKKKVFFSASIYCLNETENIYQEIINSIKDNGSEIVIDWFSPIRGLDLDNSSINNQISPEKFFSQTQRIIESDVVIAEISHLTVGVGYQIFFANLNNKPVLALYNEGLISKEKIGTIINLNSPYLLLRKYSKDSLQNIVDTFLNNRGQKLSKFNFVINQEVKDYINWLGSNKLSSSKSEILREIIISKVIYNDNDYQAFLNSKKS